ncbi:hypothetical protein BKI52_19350 [marine bacterium AO1-C]|nr:hypothetical protein BKI52_19350 [marine bacterium AO1-C]
MNAQALIKENLRTQSPYLNLGRCGLTGSEDFLELLEECAHLEGLTLADDLIGYDLPTQQWVSQGNSQRQGNRNMIAQIPPHLPKNLRTLVIRREQDSPYLLGNLKELNKLNNLELLWLEKLPEVQSLDFLQALPQLKFLHLYHLPHLTNIDALAYLQEQLIALSLGKCPLLEGFTPIGKITTLQNLDISNCDALLDTSFLEKQSDLKRLILSHHESLKKLSFGSEVNQLRQLNLDNNPRLSDIDAVSQLPFLSSLMLVKLPSVKKLPAFKGLTQLTELHLEPAASITDFSPLKDLVRLQGLRIDHSKHLVNIDFMKHLPELRVLLLHNSAELADITALRYLQKLEKLVLKSNPLLEDIEALAGLESLKYLELLYNGAIKDVTSLGNLKKLQILKLATDAPQVGSLANLTQLIELELHGNFFEDLSPLADLKQLLRLNISGQLIKDIGPLANLKQLQQLSLSGQIEEVAPISDLPALVELGLADNQLQDVSALAHLPNLAVLNLNKNRIGDISQFADFQTLQELYLDYNSLKSIEINAGFDALQVVHLKNNPLEQFNLKNLPQLQFLDLQGNLIKSVAMENLKSLYTLNLIRLGIKQITLTNLPNLHYLHLHNNRIASPHFQDLSALKRLIMTENDLEDVSCIANLKSLEVLDLSLNFRIKDFSFLQKLVNLRQLLLDNTLLDTLDFLALMPNLYFLDISGSKVTNLGPLIQVSEQFTILRISGLAIKDLSFLKHFSQLVHLSIESNDFVDISPLKHLENLDGLGLGQNPQIEDYKPLSQLRGLRYLGLKDNQIKDISFLKPLNQLVQVNLENNQVTDINVFSGFKNLQSLALKQNQVSLIRGLLLQSLPSLNYLTLHENPVKNVPKEFLDTTGNLFDLQNYLYNLAQGQVKVYQTKLILIGNGRVGKTTLIKRWLENTFNPNEPSTHAIQLHSQFLEALATEKEYDQIQLNIWDFGGQDIYHSTHRVFMQTHAVFLLLWDVSTEQALYQKDENILSKTADYQDTHHSLMDWLSYVETLSKDSPVIVVQTKRGERGQQQDPPNKAAIQQKYDTYLKDFLSVESSEKKQRQNGFFELLNCITGVVETEMEKNCVNLPASWWQVQQTIDELRQKQQTLTWDHFQAICLEKEIPSGSVFTLGRYLHDTGFFFRQEGYFNEDIILDQKWIIDIVYALFDREDNNLFLRLQKNGFFTGQDLTWAWEKKGHHKSHFELFASFMESCGVCVAIGQPYADREQKQRIPFTQREYLCPQLLPDEAIPNIEGYFPKGQGLFYKFIHPFLHAAVIQQFIVRNVQYVYRGDFKTNIKKHSIFLEIGGQKALVEAFPHKNELLVCIPQTEHQDVLARIRYELKTIQRGYYGIEEWVSIDGEGYVLLEELMQPSKNDYIKASNNQEYLRNDFLVFQGVSTRKYTSIKQATNQIIQGDVFNQANDQSVVIVGPVTGEIKIIHHHNKGQGPGGDGDNTNH